MFDNIIGQNSTVAILRQELEEGSYPHSVLFHGPLYSAKLSTALEVARVLSCDQGNGEWNCPCSSCQRHRLLTHANTLLLGTRYFDLEIAAAADVLRRSGKTAAQFFFIRTVRKLTRRFDPVLWDGGETRLRVARPLVDEIETQLDRLTPPAHIQLGEDLEKTLDAIITLTCKLSKTLSLETIPIDMIRRSTSWLHLTSAVGGSRKIVIIENVDRMYDASSNSLLKLLEEPPASAFLILTSTRRGAILPTVRSRIRPYAFLDRSSSKSAEVLKRIFREESGDYYSLREYFLYWKDINSSTLKELAHRFVDALHGDTVSRVEVLDDLAALFGPKIGRETAVAFVEELYLVLSRSLRDGSIPSGDLWRWTEIVREHCNNLERFKQNSRLTLESLFYTLGSRSFEVCRP